MNRSWQIKKISDFAEVVTGGTPKTDIKEFWENGNIPWLASGACKDEEILTATKYITKAGYDNSVAKMMPINTVVIALTGATTGKIGLLKIEACGNQSVTGILPNESFSEKYIFYYLKTIRKVILDDSYGGAQKHISQKYVKEIKIPLPPLPIQKKIVQVLDKAQDLIDFREQQLKLLDNLVQSVFYDMFGDPVTNPKGWEVRHLSDFIDIKRDISYGIVQRGEEVIDGIPVVRIRDIIKNTFEIQDFVRTSKEISDKYKRTLLIGGELLISIRGTVGKLAVAPLHTKGWNISREVAIIPLLPNTCKEFFLFSLRSHGIQHTILDNVKGVAQSGVNLKDLRKQPLPIPPISLQQEFAEKVQKIEEQKTLMQESLHQMKDNYNSLMQQAFRGELFPE